MGSGNKPLDREQLEKMTKNYEKISKYAERVADITGGIPIVGGITSSVAKGVVHISQNASSTILRKNPNKDNWYFVLQSSDFYSSVERIITKIIGESELEEKFKYSKENYRIEMFDDVLQRHENNEPTAETDITYYVLIEFNDEVFINRQQQTEPCSVTIAFMEKFKQINFESNIVYSAFEIISHGHTPSENRDYGELSEEIVIRLCNNLY